MKKTLCAIVASVLLLGSAVGGLVYLKYYKDLLVHDAYRMRWHPDSNHVSFLKDSKLYLMDVKTNEKEVILEDSSLSQILAGTSYHLYDWFPDGQRLVYLRKKSVNSDALDIIVYDLDSKKSSVIVENVFTNHIDLSPDGSKVLYSHWKFDRIPAQEENRVETLLSDESGLYILDVNSLGKTQLYSFKDKGYERYDSEGNKYYTSWAIWDYGWTPDSKAVFFQEEHSNGPYYLIDLTSKSKTPLSNDEADEILSHCLTYSRTSSIIPSPDGNKYILIEQRGSDMGPVSMHDDFYLKKSKEPVCKP